MSYAIFDSEAGARAFIAEADAANGYPKAGEPEAPYPFGWTLTHDEPRVNSHGDLWAVSTARAGVEPGADVLVVESLPADWNPGPPLV